MGFYRGTGAGYDSVLLERYFFFPLFSKLVPDQNENRPPVFSKTWVKSKAIKFIIKWLANNYLRGIIFQELGNSVFLKREGTNLKGSILRVSYVLSWCLCNLLLL